MDTSIDPESELDVKQVKEIPIVQDTGTFKHDTGDVYDGYFEAKKKDRSVKMHGSTYEGQYKDWSYSGHGKYVYPDDSVLIADFNDNVPVGNLTLVDPNGHIWLGRAEQGFGWFDPVNHFYDMLEKTRENKVKKHRKSDISSNTLFIK
ncbi:hypothetical protein KGM_200408 [Danaus plexippus plexippus]|uniref:Uncharacterized protein n=1 Tax=Danaus plexippus plexippus TaxID=278856 RepID=A0A212FDR3_DANPL|nr:hypothetical protein KGM_200408 [Danaus plexippus plexippus]